MVDSPLKRAENWTEKWTNNPEFSRTQQEVCKVVRVNYAQNMIDAGLSVHFYCIKLIILITSYKKRVITFGGLFSFY